MRPATDGLTRQVALHCINTAGDFTAVCGALRVPPGFNEDDMTKRLEAFVPNPTKFFDGDITCGDMAKFLRAVAESALKILDGELDTPTES